MAPSYTLLPKFDNQNSNQLHNPNSPLSQSPRTATMGSSADAATATAGDEVELGFAKLLGEDFEYYMQTYSILLGRYSKTTTVAVDHSSLSGGMNISLNHALHLRPRGPPVKLDSQDLLRIGNKESSSDDGEIGEIDEKKVKD